MSVEWDTFWSFLIRSWQVCKVRKDYMTILLLDVNTQPKSGPFMRRNDFSWMIGGAQGSGVDTSANIFAKAAAQGGLQVFGNREYYSNIKGEHSYFRVRLSRDVIRSHVDTVDMLATFDDETVARHAWRGPRRTER